jgi:hypothetical protein
MKTLKRISETIFPYLLLSGGPILAASFMMLNSTLALIGGGLFLLGFICMLIYLDV